MVDHARPAYLGRLNMRFGKGSDYKLPHGMSASKDDAALTAILKDKATHIRSKYKGRRAAGAVADVEDDDELHGMAGKADADVVGGKGKTSGIPIFGESDAEARVGWSLGHSDVSRKTTEELRSVAKTSKLSAENSHALGHADYGTDHELSAPSASKAQNTEQLAIELAMRKAAKDLNASAGLTDGTSLVHMKITDALDAKTGQLRARRLKLIRRKDAADKEGTVVFDHLMDGDRLHISKDDAYSVGKQAHTSLMAGKAVPRATARHGDGKGIGDRKGMDAAAAPTRDDLHDHQKQVLKDLKANQAAAEATGKHRFKNEIDDRKGVKMVGPAFTDVDFPGGAQGETGQKALEAVRDTVATAQSKSPEEKAVLQKRFETSGSLPADADSKMQKRMNTLMDTFGDRLASGTDDIDVDDDAPIDFSKGSDHAHRVAMQQAVRDSGMSPDDQQLLGLQFARVKRSGNHSRLSADEKKLLLGVHSISEGLPDHEVLTKSKRQEKAKQLFTASSFLAASDDEEEHKSNSSDNDSSDDETGMSSGLALSNSHPSVQKPSSSMFPQHSPASLGAPSVFGEDLDDEDDFGDEEDYAGDFGDDEAHDEPPGFVAKRVAQKAKRAFGAEDEPSEEEERKVKKKRRDMGGAKSRIVRKQGPKGPGKRKPPKY